MHENTFMQQVEENDVSHTVLKWGCDGNSGHSTYKQSFREETDAQPQSDADIFAISFVPLQIYSEAPKAVRKRSSLTILSHRRLGFADLLNYMTKREIALIEEQIKSLAPTEVSTGKRVYSDSHIILLTKVNGKICNTLTETSSHRCYICKATPKEMNNINLAHDSEDPSTFTFDISVLHVWIRCFECLLQISYWLPLKK